MYEGVGDMHGGGVGGVGDWLGRSCCVRSGAGMVLAWLAGAGLAGAGLLGGSYSVVGVGGAGTGVGLGTGVESGSGSGWVAKIGVSQMGMESGSGCVGCDGWGGCVGAMKKVVGSGGVSGDGG